MDDGRKGDGSDEVQVVRGYCLFVFRSAGRVGEKREWEGYVCVCKIDSSIGTSNHTLMEWRFLDSNRGFFIYFVVPLKLYGKGRECNSQSE